MSVKNHIVTWFGIGCFVVAIGCGVVMLAVH